MNGGDTESVDQGTSENQVSLLHILPVLRKRIHTNERKGFPDGANASLPSNVDDRIELYYPNRYSLTLQAPKAESGKISGEDKRATTFPSKMTAIAFTPGQAPSEQLLSVRDNPTCTVHIRPVPVTQYSRSCFWTGSSRRR